MSYTQRGSAVDAVRYEPHRSCFWVNEEFTGGVRWNG